MPITTPLELAEQYKGDTDHFTHVLEHLFIPALENAGFEAISPKSTGSPVIQAEIIKQLSSCELVLCDMSILNPNVFFELGIRTALDKPVALVVDDKTAPLPFDTHILNFYRYDSSLTPWTLEEQKQKLAEHVQEADKKSKGRNDLWKYFGVAQVGTFKPEEAELGEKIDLIMNRLSTIEMEQRRPEPVVASYDTTKYWPALASYLGLVEDAKRLEQLRHLRKLAHDYKVEIGTSEKPKVERDKFQEPDPGNP
jgi:hypothetical protein